MPLSVIWSGWKGLWDLSNSECYHAREQALVGLRVEVQFMNKVHSPWVEQPLASVGLDPLVLNPVASVMQDHQSEVCPFGVLNPWKSQMQATWLGWKVPVCVMTIQQFVPADWAKGPYDIAAVW